MFDWNFNKERADLEMDVIRKTVIGKVEDDSMPKDWDDFEREIIDIKYDSKHEARQNIQERVKV